MLEIPPTVISVKEAPPGWSVDPRYVYIGRRMPSKSLNGSAWANPYRIQPGQSRGSTLERYEHLIRTRLMSDRLFKEKLLALSGKTLVCWCKPRPCHGDILVKLFNELVGGALK